MDNSRIIAYKKAEQKVRQIKGFYKHLTVYLIVNSVIVLYGLRSIETNAMKLSEIDPSLVEYAFWNILGTPVLWGIGLLIHGLRVFGPQMKMIKQWEEEQIRKRMEDDFSSH